MKREAVIAILSMLTLGGCTKSGDLPFEDSTQHTEKISINVLNSQGDPLTRGSIVDTQEKMASVGMYCAHTLLADWSISTFFDKMSNNKFTYSNKEWAWNPEDNNGDNQPAWGHTALTDKYTFFAYSPHSSDITDNRLSASLVNAQPELTFTVASYIPEQEDLMAAKPRKNIHPQSGGKVSMQFYHALTKVSFSVKGVNTKKIKSITIKDIHNRGKLTFIEASPYFEWIEQSGTYDYTASTIDDGGNGTLLDITPDADKSIATLLTSEIGYLFMLPQDVSNKTIELVITNIDGTDEQTKTLNTPAKSKWIQNQHINYVITLEENTIDLTVNILDWDEESIDVSTNGTYLNILDNSIGSFDGNDALIYYSTDHRHEDEVTASYEKTDDPSISSPLSKHTATGSNYFLFPASMLDFGEYIVTINAGKHLTRKLKVTVTKGEVVISPIDWDDTEIDGSSQGTHITISDTEVNITANQTVNIYYSTNAKSVSSSVDNPQITITESKGRITLQADSDIVAPATAILKIQADKITKKIRIKIN